MDKRYATRNLSEASYLQAKGEKIIGKERQGDKVKIVFSETKSLQKLSLEFYNGGGSVEPKLLFDTFKSLKDYIYMT